MISIRRQQEETDMWEQYRQDTDAKRRAFESGFHRDIGRDALRLVKAIGVTDTKKYFRHGTSYDAKVKHVTSLPFPFIDDAGRELTLSAAVSRLRNIIEKSPLPPFVLPTPHSVRPVVEQVDITVTEATDNERSTIASLTALDYSERLPVMGSLNLTALQTFEIFSGFLVVAQSVVIGKTIPTSADIDKLFSQRVPSSVYLQRLEERANSVDGEE